uniref:Uncharacterized protein n=1 Tax=Arundo donax TaxID=35708 RepID=A0A0A9E690_ARUDO
MVSQLDGSRSFLPSLLLPATCLPPVSISFSAASPCAATSPALLLPCMCCNSSHPPAPLPNPSQQLLLPPFCSPA